MNCSRISSTTFQGGILIIKKKSSFGRIPAISLRFSDNLPFVMSETLLHNSCSITTQLVEMLPLYFANPNEHCSVLGRNNYQYYLIQLDNQIVFFHGSMSYYIAIIFEELEINQTSLVC